MHVHSYNSMTLC